MDLISKLRALSEEEAKIRTDLSIASEQLVFLQEVADDAETRKVVSETPLADREFNEARSDLERHRRYRDDLMRRLEEISRRRDELLDQMNRPPAT